MKRSVRALLLLLLLSLLTASLVSCDSRATVVKNFDAAGWDVKTINPNADEDRAVILRICSEAELKKFPSCEIIVCSKSRIPLAGILCFDTGSQLRQYLDSLGEDAYETAREEGRIRNNCYLFYAGYGAIEIYLK